jgi:hypothetical protein
MATRNRAKPRVFVGSSKESLDYAYAIQQNLDDDAEVTVWKQGIFDLTKTTVESLIRALDRTDFAIFVFAPNDVLRLRRKSFAAVRDNVVFELGLFMGRLGRSRTFAVAPRGKQNLRIPTDLAGVTLGGYNTRADKNLEAALGPFCNQVRRQLRKVGLRVKRPVRRLLRRGDLVVEKASYGARRHRVDVTEALNRLIKKGRLAAYVGNQLGGDPCPNVRKDLQITYSFKGTANSLVIPEGYDLTLPPDVAQVTLSPSDLIDRLLNKLVVHIADSTGIKIRDMGAHVFAIYSTATGQMLRRIARDSLRDVPPSAARDWQKGQGVVGWCWEIQEKVVLDLTDIAHRDVAATEWNARSPADRLGMTFEEFRSTTKPFKAVFAVPIQVLDTFIGALSVNIDKAADVSVGNVWPKPIRDLMYTTAANIASLAPAGS